MNKKLLIACMLLIGIVFTGYGQIRISGIVTDAADGTTLPGVTVRIKDTTQGTQTNMDGQFEVAAAEDAVLVFSFIGMASVEVPVEGRSIINIAMKADITNLQEFVLIGYGTGTRQDLTAPITTISSEEISRQITSNPAQALQGKVAGMQVTNSGEPGSQPQIRIRGVSTVFAGGGGPLYVVDGVIVNNINFLNNNDIESMTVLKDASAGAIYGVQAANGVILVTTKEGKKGDTQVNFSSYTGFQQATNIMEMANTAQYIELLNQRTGLTGIGNIIDPGLHTISTNWYDELTRSAMITSHELSISGGTDNSSYSYGIGYFYQDGILDSHNPTNNNNFNRLNFRAKSDYYFNNIDLGYNLIFSQNNTTPAFNYALFQGYVAPPAFEARQDNGEWTDPTVLGFSGPFANPLASAYYHDVVNEEYVIIPSTYFSMDFAEYFNFRSSLSANLSFGQGKSYNPTYYVSGLQANSTSSLNKNNNFSRNLQFDNTMEYSRFFNQHSLKILAGSSLQDFFSNYLTATGYNVPLLPGENPYIRLGDDHNRDGNDGGFKSRVASFFSRVSYNYDSKYLLMATIRADGSSKYNEHWGYFPSLGLGWVISQEEFMRNQDVFNYLKFRGSWGQLGNNNVPPNSVEIVGAPGPGTTGIFGGNNPVPGLTFQTVYNNFMLWEMIEEFNGGVEIFTLANRLNLELDFYNRTTYDAVFTAPIPGVAGTESLLGNNGTIRNRGIEMVLRWTDTNNAGDLTYSLSGNFSTVNNEVLAIRNESGVIFGALTNGQFLTRTVVGQPVGAFYGYNVIGIFQSFEEINNYTSDNGVRLQPDALPGDFIFENVNGDDVIDERDRVMLGSPIPDFTFGFTASVSYKQWDASAVIQGVYGNKIYNAKRTVRNIFPDANYDRDFYDNHWQGSGTSNTYPSAALTRRNIFPNSFFVESGSYVRIRNVQIGYTLPENVRQKLRMRSLRVYVSAQNPVTFFAYNGYTPEIGGSPIATGIDNQTYPLSATFTGGVNVTF
ncbi:MAG: TonB-dependent receptor [Bacteroidia bacterium]|nr:MAG: TonB-dependent receptor [Bacteroidia bacterium]